MPNEVQRKFRVMINAPIGAVWKEITRTDEPILCFFNNRMHLSRAGLSKGSKLAMRSPDGKYTGVVGEILEVDPPVRFSHTFRFTNFNDPPCRVTYELRAVGGGDGSVEGGGTEFTLTIDELPVGTRSAKQMSQGGPMIVNTLKAVIETGRPTVGVRVLYFAFKVLGPMLSPRACRSEHWPVD